MAFYRTVVARTGFVEEMIKDMAGNIAFVSRDGQWRGPVADDESGAIETANEKFVNDSIFTNSTLAEGSTEAWEILSNESFTVIGWSMTADGWFDEDED